MRIKDIKEVIQTNVNNLQETDMNLGDIMDIEISSLLDEEIEELGTVVDCLEGCLIDNLLLEDADGNYIVLIERYVNANSSGYTLKFGDNDLMYSLWNEMVDDSDFEEESHRQRLDNMPYAHRFWFVNNDGEEVNELCNATGWTVFFDEDGIWYDEFVDSEGNYHYGN